MTTVIPCRGAGGDDGAMARAVVPPAFDFDRAPFLVIWEVTRACALACLHCRADAAHPRDPRERPPEQGSRGSERGGESSERPPLLVLTGGDPMLRPDLAELIGF